MFRIAGNLQRVIAIGAVLLSLSTLAQSSGVFCLMGACGADVAARPGDQHACCHQQACCEHEQQSPCDSPSDHHPESCPCPDQCWCHLAPQPLEPPKTSGGPLELALISAFAVDADTLAGVVADQHPSMGCLSPPGAGGKSAARRCVELCRFLI